MSAAVPDLLAGNDLLESVLEASLTALNLLRPFYGPGGELLDFSLDYLNPAGQRMVGLPARPGGPVSQHFPHAQSNGLLAFYQRVFETGEAGEFGFPYRAQEQESFFLVAARRSGEVLVVSIIDSSQHPEHPALEQALRQSQAREQAARQAAERERNLLQTVLTQAPVAIGLFQGDDCVVAAANDQLCAMWGYPPAEVVGRPLLAGVPELQGQGFTELIQEVARTRVPFVGQAVAAQLLQNDRLETHYFNFVYQALLDVQGGLLGVLDIAVDVTEQVLARQQVQRLNEELAATNEELAATNEELTTANEEFLASNAALAEAQLQLQQLNQELETRVAERTKALRRAQAATEQQRRQLARLFEQVPAAICILSGADLLLELVNPGYQALFPGRTLIGLPLLAALPELASSPVWDTLRRVYATGETHEEPEILIPMARHKGGPPEDFYFHYIQQARYDEQGRIDGVVVFALNITAQTLAQRQAAALQAEVLATAQRQAQEREAFYRVFEQTPAVVAFLRGPEHRLAYFNDAYQQLFPGRQLQGRTVAETQPESEAQGFVALLDQVYATGETFFGNELLLRTEATAAAPAKDIYFNFTYQAYREDGQIGGISVFAYDVTEQVLARQQRAAAQAQLQAVFEQAPVAIAILQGPDYVVEIVNSSMCALWGLPAAAAVGQPVFDVLPAAAGHHFRGLLDEVRQTGMPYVAHEMPAVLSHERHRVPLFFNVVYQPLAGPPGRPSAVVVLATDVSQQVAARQQLALANEELQATNQQLTRTNADLDNFIYAASHDLKAPITNIEGLLLALREQLPPAVRQTEQVRPLLRMMGDAVERFQKTIGDLTDISKLQQAHAQPAEPVDLATLIEEISLDLAPALPPSTRVLVDVAACPTVSFAPKNLRSIIYNLLSNAVKYAAPDRPAVVQLRSRRTAGACLLEVQDNGLGLTAAQQTRLFGMFQRLHSHVEGSGVGLYMVKKIVDNAGGTITVQSEPGVGSTFTVRLPDEEASVG
ncbi:PAS domain-containing protein [Hymenobacter psoromatis]|uniref:PAS domain-containing protein n=1 Tax=Hymenobacter psoromatis TaxID=1484116 RepID=UPI001CC0CA0B|nr:PAS domain-containing protein [Hymenobacter psoromatis]